MTMTTNIWVTPLQAALGNAGVSTHDAELISLTYPDADPDAFVAGLQWTAQTYFDLKVSPLPLPSGAPWQGIAALMQPAAPGDIEDAFRNGLAQEPVGIQTPLFNAVMGCVNWQQAQNQTGPTPPAQTKRRRILSAEYLKVLNDLGYTFRMNILNDMVEVQRNGAWEILSDPIAALIRREMRDKGYEQVNVMEDAYTAEAYLNRYHPVQDYLNSLQYDGGNYIEQLAGHFVDVDGVFAFMLRRWLIGAVAKAHLGVQNRMLVMEGNQGLGKSEFVKWLASVVPDAYIEGPIETGDKDNLIRLASRWVWEVSEFGNTVRRSDRDALKFFLSMNRVTVRKSYGRIDMVKPTLASWIGTFNDEGGVLNDPTGSRRFMVCKLTAIDWSYTQLDPNKIWAEANAAFRSGEPWNLQPDEAARTNQVNERYEMDDPVEGLLKQFYHVDPQDKTWTPSHEILTLLEANGLRGGSTRQNAMALASVMKKCGIERKKGDNKNGQRVWGYTGVRII